jgi:hypothetical protein
MFALLEVCDSIMTKTEIYGTRIALLSIVTSPEFNDLASSRGSISWQGQEIFLLYTAPGPVLEPFQWILTHSLMELSPS